MSDLDYAGLGTGLCDDSNLGDLESNVRSYSRSWPAIFSRAAGSVLHSTDGGRYLDFFAGAGALNYGHNNPVLKSRLIDYLVDDGVIHSLDTMTVAKATFLSTFRELILEPRGLDYKVQFTGPTGTNAVEAAFKLARKVTGRETIAAFTRGFHGMTLGALAATGSATKRNGAGVALGNVLRLPFDGHGNHKISGLDLLEDLIGDSGSGVSRPAAVIVETIQGEGGVNVASATWLRRLAEICQSQGILLIVDDIQAGCGRSGTFFSFEAAGIVPDIVCLSKSISGYGLPMALTIFRRELDVWEPGEHNGTFRGNNAAFVTATAALEEYWRDETLSRDTRRKGELLLEELAGICREHASLGAVCRGRGLFCGIAIARAELAPLICQAAFARGLIIETSGTDDEVVKFIPALTISEEELLEGLGILRAAICDVIAADHRPAGATSSRKCA